MKVCIIQPAYSTDFEKIDLYYEEQMKLVSQCDESMDIIVLPESCDIPCLAGSKENAELAAEKFNKRFLEAMADTARRCNAIVFANARSFTEDGRGRNTTYAFDRSGNIY